MKLVAYRIDCLFSLDRVAELQSVRDDVGWNMNEKHLRCSKSALWEVDDHCLTVMSPRRQDPCHP